ncbi:MAG: hypothetical protein GKR90_00045 [Pseudomonadales bacterium]|nr:hypothetical protein [Pseudomonadales bacterium]
MLQQRFLWWIAGGYAIELALGEPIRPYSDIDLLILRPDHRQVRVWLSNWDDPVYQIVPATVVGWPIVPGF